jgi:hypothetical protein
VLSIVISVNKGGFEAMNGIFISVSTFRELSQACQSEVLANLGLQGAAHGTSHVEVGHIPAGASLSGDGPVELTVAMVRKLADKLGDKTLAALKVIASSNAPAFHLKDVVAGVPGVTSYQDLRGVWSALTRRTRNIMDDSAVDLIWWTGEQVFDAEGNYVDEVGAISTLTHASLRSHFGF